MKTRLAPRLGERGAADPCRSILDTRTQATRALAGVRREMGGPHHPGAARRLVEAGRFGESLA
ncbi:MAG: hypothetical protein Q8W47_02120 [Candidatus Palauibacterales bacterium]|nr:hypothetical protein [Candidatus Palauibacterales bacterium]